MSFSNCLRCGVPNNWFGVAKIQKNGICELCTVYDSVKCYITDFSRLQKVFEKAIYAYKDKFEYDVAVGFSGGKDSSFICYTLKKKYNCRVLAVTANLGFMPSGPAIENMKRVTTNLNIDHIFVDYTAAEIKKAFINSIMYYSDLCMLCSRLCWDAVRKIAIEKHIPCYVMGSDRGQLLRMFDKQSANKVQNIIDNKIDPYKDLVNKNLKLMSDKDVRLNRRYYQNRGLSRTIVKDIFPLMRLLPGSDIPSLHIQFFDYFPYEEKNIKKMLFKELNWEIPSGDHLHAHHDCLLHDTSQYMTREILGETVTAGEICVDSREGYITREEALEVINHEKEHLDSLKDPFESVESVLGIRSSDMKRVMWRARIYIKGLRLLQKIKKIFYR